MEQNLKDVILNILEDIFNLYDFNKNEMIEITYLGNILRALGCVPTENEIHQLITDFDVNQDHPGYLNKECFLECMQEIFSKKRFQPKYDEDLEKLLEIFKNFDPYNLGYVKKEIVEQHFKNSGEPFNDDELRTMMKLTADRTGKIDYYHYLNQLMFKIPPQIDLFQLYEELANTNLFPNPNEEFR